MNNKRVAVTGFSFRFPGTNKQDYWQDLLQGKDLVTEVEPQRWSQEAFRHPNKGNPGTGYTNAAGSIGDISMFDAGFFGISPREASMMDPQQRMLLEMSWEALENSGIKPSTIKGSPCGVFIGIASADYSYRLADDLAAVDSSVATGNTASIAANRISYVLDLRGPSMAIDTACSSSMVAFHQACRSILSGETTQAITGGVSLHLHPYGFIVFSKASMLSRKGRCNVFDADGDGYVRSEGGGIFFLKDYDQAVADGNPILAVVANSVVNTDGRKSGITVPSSQVQASLLEQAYKQAGIRPEQIDYLEAHGTGTAVGDPIETNAIGNALGKHRSKDNPLLIGSVKSNMGHLEAASGVAGLVKAIQCLQKRTVPATIGIKNLNPNIPFDDLNIKVVTENHQLKQDGKLIVGVNSFGFGGANAHIILESHEQPKPTALATVSTLPIVISGKDHVALKDAANALAEMLRGTAKHALYDIAYNAIFRRDLHTHRAVLYAQTTEEAANALSDFAHDIEETENTIEIGTAVAAAKGPAFIYSGNGAQWEGMGKRLMSEEPIFKQAVVEVDMLFRQHADYSLIDELNGMNGEPRYGLTEFAQPALFALQVGITQMLRHRGLMPAAVAGHSVGEVAAAWASGALSLQDAVSVIYHRSQLQGTTKGGGEMTAVGLPNEAGIAMLAELGLTSEIAIAGVNGPRGITIAGRPASLAKLEVQLAAQSIPHKRLDLDYAFHSSSMDSIESGVITALAHLQPQETIVPYYSTVTGKRLSGKELGTEYWWHNIRQPVLFERAIQSIIEQGINIFVEIGPHSILRTYVNDCLKEAEVEGQVITTAVRGDDSAKRIWSSIGQAIIAGVNLDWKRTFSTPGKFIALPNYPWQRERHWHSITSESVGLLTRHKQHSLLGYPLNQHDLTWENQIDTKRNPMLADHVVGDSIVFPGSGFAELALAASVALHGKGLIEIEELEIRAPLILSKDHSALTRTVIDAKDGSITIKSRPYASDEPFALHATARVLQEPTDIRLNKSMPEIPTRAPDFSGESHALLTRAANLDYGPAFQCISHGWIQQDTAFAAFTVPEVIKDELAQGYLHPALLDCTFQLIIQLLKEDVGLHNGFTFVPTKMGRIMLRSDVGIPAYAKATLLNRSTHSLTGEFTLFDEQGNVIAAISEARFRSVRLGKNAADHLRFLDYHGVPKPHPSSNNQTTAIPFTAVQTAVEELARRATLKGTHRRYCEEVDPLLDSLCSQFTIQALRQLSEDGSRLSKASINSLKQTSQHLAPFITQLIARVEEDGILSADSDGWQLANSDEEMTAQDIWNSLIADYPDYFQIVHSVGRIGMHLPLILEANASVESLCPKETSLVSLTRQVLGAAGRQKTGAMLRDLIATQLQQLPTGQRLAMLEISQGMPVFAMDVCNVMDFNRCDYIFATSSATTIEEAAHTHERYPQMAMQLFDANLDAQAHIAVVTLDFDSQESTLEALRYARRNLAPQGNLIVIGMHASRWMDFVFGAGSSYWNTSSNGQFISRQRSSTYWSQQLQKLDFTNVDTYEFSPDTLAGPFILLAKSAEVASEDSKVKVAVPRSWIVFSGGDNCSADLSNRLTGTLQQRGDMVIQSSANSVKDITNLLQETTQQYGQLDGIVHLAGLTQPEATTPAVSLVARQVDRCALAASIVQACEATQTNTTCWLVTTGAVESLRDETVSTCAPIPADAALWGFGRTLINEAANCQIRMIDLQDPIPGNEALSALDRELLQADDEQEVILTRMGARYVPRLRIEPPPHAKTAIDSPTVRLNFQMPGQLRNLRWEAHPRIAPKGDEIEVDIHATGLNFRDVMYALGLLSDEAIENGFAGPTLGLEFSGIVRSIGPDVTDFAPGDKVVGFGPSSFANRAITQSSAISHIPPGISFEAAATIPSTFFTVYYALRHLAQVEPGEKILIHGAAGGVGIAAIQLAKWIGAEIYVTAGSDEKRDFLRLLGVDHIFDSRSLTFADEILALTDGKGVDVVLNSLAGEAINRNFKVLKPFGRFLELGKRDFYENTKIGLRPFRNNISYFGIDADQLMQARPQLTRRLFAEMMGLFAEGVLHPLPYHVFEADDIVDAFRYMQQARQIGKIVITYRNAISHIHMPAVAKKALALAPNASYLVTGGLGGFGLRTAEWLAEKGARNLVLISRSGPTSIDALEGIARLEKQGVKIHAISCDITDESALTALFKDIEKNMPPLRGIVHAATVINDGLVRNMDAEQIRSVLAPKVMGASFLHDLTKEMPLDFFVMFSSATTLFGNPGQSNYVAANTSLEALAQYRRSKGLPATCVRWGAIDDVGFLARNEKIKDALQSRMGGGALNSTVALGALENMMVNERSGLGVMELDWSALARFLPSATSPKFSDIAAQAEDSDTTEDNADDVQRMLAELSDDELHLTLTEMIRSEVGEILRVAADKIDPSKSIYDMGLDSLMGVELVVALESRFGIRLPVMALSQSPTIAKLVERIVQQLRETADAEQIEEPDMVAQMRQLATQHGQDISEESIAALVEDITASDGTNRIIH